MRQACRWPRRRPRRLDRMAARRRAQPADPDRRPEPARLDRVAGATRSPPGAGRTEAQDVAREYGLRRPVVMLQSDHPALLVTWGFVAPKVILPRTRPGLDRRAHPRRPVARARAHPARRLADPDARRSRPRRLLVQPGDVDRLPPAAPRKRAARPTMSCCAPPASTARSTPRICWISRAPSRAIARGCPRRRLPVPRVSKGESAPC